MNHSFKEEAKTDNDVLSKILEFKELWVKLTDENKDTVKDYMILLCSLAQNYFLEVIDK